MGNKHKGCPKRNTTIKQHKMKLKCKMHKQMSDPLVCKVTNVYPLGCNVSQHRICQYESNVSNQITIAQDLVLGQWVDSKLSRFRVSDKWLV